MGVPGDGSMMRYSSMRRFNRQSSSFLRVVYAMTLFYSLSICSGQKRGRSKTTVTCVRIAYKVQFHVAANTGEESTRQSSRRKCRGTP